MSPARAALDALLNSAVPKELRPAFDALLRAYENELKGAAIAAPVRMEPVVLSEKAPRHSRRAPVPSAEYPNAGKPWSQQEDELLSANFNRDSVSELCRALGRNPVAVLSRAKHLNLT